VRKIVFYDFCRTASLKLEVFADVLGQNRKGRYSEVTVGGETEKKEKKIV
jgi:hypothetical protein